jgi:hypothetical protein
MICFSVFGRADWEALYLKGGTHSLHTLTLICICVCSSIKGLSSASSLAHRCNTVLPQGQTVLAQHDRRHKPNPVMSTATQNEELAGKPC